MQSCDFFKSPWPFMANGLGQARQNISVSKANTYVRGQHICEKGLQGLAQASLCPCSPFMGSLSSLIVLSSVSLNDPGKWGS